MTRELALKITNALTGIEDFELFIEEIEKVCKDFELTDFEPKLIQFLNEELKKKRNFRKIIKKG